MVNSTSQCREKRIPQISTYLATATTTTPQRTYFTSPFYQQCRNRAGRNTIVEIVLTCFFFQCTILRQKKYIFQFLNLNLAIIFILLIALNAYSFAMCPSHVLICKVNRRCLHRSRIFRSLVSHIRLFTSEST